MIDQSSGRLSATDDATRPRPEPPAAPESALRPQRATWLLAGLGILISGYLTWVHASNTIPFCAGIGQCDLVQSSSYAQIFGLPVAYLGLATYLALLALIALRTSARGVAAEGALLLQFLLLLGGVLFSGWLTYVEVFILEAICPWCVASAIVITLLFGLTARDVWRAQRAGG